MSAMIQSIIENSNKNRNYNIFILYTDISPASKEMLKRQIGNISYFSINFIDVTLLVGKYDYFIGNRADITIETYFRLFIPKLFFKYEKVIYLDGDMICCTDIAELFDIDLEENFIASSRDMLGTTSCYINPERMQYRKDILKLKNINNYFIAGMLIFNIKQILNTFSTNEILAFAVSKKWKFHDQDILNVLFEGKTLLLSMQWDFSYIHPDRMKILPEDLQLEYMNAKKCPKIIHFADDAKPWLNLTNIPYFEYFWKYATRIPFINIIIDRMNNNGYIGITCKERVILDIKHRKRTGMLFILNCFKAWILRNFYK
jgi:lipopolysaccharide biosynthesis glycosyltransferase